MGITPACAGNMLTFNVKQCLTRTHTRSRGEYTLLADLFTDLIGSPPLARVIFRVHMEFK